MNILINQESIELPDGASEVRLNNRLRRTVEAALGGLTLLSPDPAKRLAAAMTTVNLMPPETLGHSAFAISAELAVVDMQGAVTPTPCRVGSGSR